MLGEGSLVSLLCISLGEKYTLSVCVYEIVFG